MLEKYSFDAWGKRRFTSGAADPSETITASSNRGYTTHEHLEEVGLVHMNGRVYDPLIARFLSADPFVDDPTASQSLNRYSYVNNNPITYSDPTGYFKFGKIFKTILRIFVQAIAQVVGTIACGGNPACGLALAGAVGGLFDGQGLKGVLFGAIRGVSSFGFLGDGLLGGIQAAANKGKFGTGFLSGAASGLFRNIASAFVQIGEIDGAAAFAIKGIGNSIAGGTASAIGGGKFANGAYSAGFDYAVNAWAHGAIQAVSNAADQFEEANKRARDMALQPAAFYGPAVQLGIRLGQILLGGSGLYGACRAGGNCKDLNVFNSEADDETAPPAKPGDVLSPGGRPVGDVEKGATPDIRTVNPKKLDGIIDALKGLGAKPDPGKTRYPGEWYSLPGNQGGFGVRESTKGGRTLDVDIPSVPDVSKIHQKP